MHLKQKLKSKLTKAGRLVYILVAGLLCTILEFIDPILIIIFILFIFIILS